LPLPFPSAPFEPLLRIVESAAEARIDWIQIREKDLSGGECAALVHQALRRTAQYSPESATTTRILVNDRLDVALAEQAGGVHLAENSIFLEDAKRMVATQAASAHFLVGVSCHSLEAAICAARDGADYLIFGPVFPTPSKVIYGPSQGPNSLAAVCRSVSIPVLAIGGITLENAASCLSAGAAGIAAIRLFQHAANLPSLVKNLHGL